MINSLLKNIYLELKKKAYDAYFVDISNENLYEFVSDDENLVLKLTGFTGDTGSLLMLRDKAILYVDGRFTIQAKVEIKDRFIKIVNVNRRQKLIDDIASRLKKGARLAFNPKIESIKTIESLNTSLSDKNIKLIADDKFFNYLTNSNSGNKNDLEKGKLFVLDNRYVSKTPKKKISELLINLKESGFTHYITSSLEEIAYITNIRKMPVGNVSKVLSDAFMIISKNRSYLYTDDLADKKVISHLSRNGIKFASYNSFYDDLTDLRKVKYSLDPSLNNYYIYKKLSIKDNKSLVASPLTLVKSIRGRKEKQALLKCNIIDGVAITKAIYDIKRRVANGDKLTEYDAKLIVDEYRKKIGGKDYFSPSFDTIVAYKENSAICHYSPKINASKLLKKNSLLLIDSGGNYIFGTTDITRTISLYDKTVPASVKKHYTLALNSLMTLSMQKFPYGITGNELDIVARQNLYNEYLDFNHGTGHGIGYISNVHEGPNRISVGVCGDRKLNVIEPYQVMSDEPGLYFEDKYGIRLENDLMSIPDSKNEFGDFISFIHLTICPFDRNLIDEKLIDKKVVKYLNDYNKMVYSKLYKKLDSYERKMLMNDIKEFKI